MTVLAFHRVAFGLALGLSLAACAPLEEDAGDDVSTDEVTSAGSYVRLRRDTRRCVSPLCGGYWVSRVNQRTLRCADGSTATECYVAEVDYSGLGLTGDELAAVMDRPVIYRGRIVSRTFGSFGNLGQLTVQEGWRAASDAASAATVFAAYDNGRVCVRAPCFTRTADKLNGRTSYTLTGVDLSGVAGVSATDLRAGTDALATPSGVLVAGVVRSSGQNRTLAASQFYLRLSTGVPDATYCDTDAECTMTAYSHDVSAREDCYCALCPSTALNVSSAERFASDYRRHCSIALRCPAVRCVRPPTVSCVNHACTAGTPL